ncbi:MAG TPA: adenylate/guanylate cyclase domain-containing protein [Acidimicrobiia bacterium]|nr:adenylate/guanylate cyclase domain-containing protein [Acidimicrobiia bacterium]
MIGAGQQPRSWLRIGVWALHMVLPLLGLWLLLAAPDLDAHWQHNPTHFWLVAGVAIINVLLAVRISEAAARRQDARLFLVSIAFQLSAAFIGLHALATPQILIAGANAGFVLASPVGLALASLVVAVSSLPLSDRVSSWVVRNARSLRYGVVALILVWAFLSLNQLPPLRGVIEEELGRGGWAVAGAVAVGLYLVAAWRFFQLHRRRPSAVSLAIATAFVLLAEAMVAVIVARAWRLSWWEWHLLALAGFGYLWYAAHLQHRHQGNPVGLFDGVALESTVVEIRHQYHEALEEMVAAMSSGSFEQRQATSRRLGATLGLTGVQTEVLCQAAEALAQERRQSELLGAMAELARRAHISEDEHSFAGQVEELIGKASGLRIELSLEDGPGAGVGEQFPVRVKGDQIGSLRVGEGNGELSFWDRSLFESLAGQVSIAIENRRLYTELSRLFSRYTSPELARALLSGEVRRELGGTVAEVTVLFADLKGFTAFSERVAHPEVVVRQLNSYFAAAVPALRAHGGTVDKFVGDALMAVFNTPVLQPDHALRAVRAARAMNEAVAQLGQGELRFRIGVNTGPALVGNIGSEDLRNFTVIGDAVNVASRLEARAEPGEIVLGATTAALVRHVAVLEPLGSLEVKGRSEPVEAFQLVDLRE